MSKTAIRWFFIALIPMLFLQLLVAKKYEEPYPAVMFPGFGQVPPTPWYPYSYERMILYAYTSTDSTALTLDQLFDPFPETALFAPMRTKLRFIADTITSTQGKEEERALLYFLQDKVRDQLGEAVQRVELAFYQYQAKADGRTSLVNIIDRKVLYFQDNHLPAVTTRP